MSECLCLLAFRGGGDEGFLEHPAIAGAKTESQQAGRQNARLALATLRGSKRWDMTTAARRLARFDTIK